MKIAVGLKRSEQIYNTEYLRFLRQIGVTHVIGYACPEDQVSSKDGYWSYEDLARMVKHYKDNGLVIDGIENLPPRLWLNILHNGPDRQREIDNVRRTIENMGKAGIPTLGYNFSLTGCPERYDEPVGRAGVSSVVYDEAKYPQKYKCMPRSMTWNSVIDPDAKGCFPPVSREEMRDRLYRFLDDVMPSAVDAKVALAAHPEDPPVPYIYSMGRVLITPGDFDEMLARYDTPYCSVEFCQGTFTEMGVDIYDTIRHYAEMGRIAYVHMRNVAGKLPRYAEVMIDDGDVDMARAFRTYYEAGYRGSFIPDHYPELSAMTDNAASLAFTIGYMRGTLMAAGIPIWGRDYVD